MTAESIPDTAERLAAFTKHRLADPTTEEMTEGFDLIQVDLVRLNGRSFDGVAQLPLPDPDAQGEVWEGGPRAS